MSFFPVLELMDRLVIAQIKAERIGSNQEELAWYTKHAEQFDLESSK